VSDAPKMPAIFAPIFEADAKLQRQLPLRTLLAFVRL
jgi:hypothetical protein